MSEVPLNFPTQNTDVPTEWVGAWQLCSSTERSYWLQTRRLHGSLGIATHRPDFSGRQGWADFSYEELMLLAEQRGVAGACIAHEGILHRRRQIDYLPRRGDPWLRRLRREGDRLIDTSLDGRDAMAWQQLAGADQEIVALRFQDAGLGKDGDDQRKGYLLIAGPCFMFVRDRVVFTQRADSLATLAECKDFSREQLIEVLDFEISFGRRPDDGAPWPIQLSTLPFREGRLLMDDVTLRDIITGAGAGPRRVKRDGKLFNRYWLLDEWSNPRP